MLPVKWPAPCAVARSSAASATSPAIGLISTISARRRVTAPSSSITVATAKASADEDHAADPCADPGGALDHGEQDSGGDHREGGAPSLPFPRAVAAAGRIQRRGDSRENEHGESRLQLVADAVEASAQDRVRPEQRAHQQLRVREGVHDDGRERHDRRGERRARPRQQGVGERAEQQAARSDRGVLHRGAGLERRWSEHHHRRPQHPQRAGPHGPSRACARSEPIRAAAAPRRAAGTPAPSGALSRSPAGAHQAAQARRVQRAVGVDRIAAHVGGDRCHAEVVEDRRRDVDGRDQAALVRRLRAQLAPAAPQSRGGHPQQFVSGGARDALDDDQRALPRLVRRSAPAGRDSPASRPADRRRGAAWPRSARAPARAASAPSPATPRRRGRRGRPPPGRRCRPSRRCRHSPRRRGSARPAGRDAAAAVRLRRACAPPPSRRPRRPSRRRQRQRGRERPGVGGGGDPRALGDVEQKLRRRVGALGRGHDPHRQARHARERGLECFRRPSPPARRPGPERRRRVGRNASTTELRADARGGRRDQRGRAGQRGRPQHRTAARWAQPSAPSAATPGCAPRRWAARATIRPRCPAWRRQHRALDVHARQQPVEPCRNPPGRAPDDVAARRAAAGSGPRARRGTRRLPGSGRTP